MRKVNFNNLNNIEIPESWTQKALNLPNAPIKKKSVFALSSFYRRLSFVACCVLACALSVTIFGFMKNDILPQKTPAESTVNSTAYNTSYSETATQNSGITQKPTSVKPTKNIEPTEEATENPSGESSTQTQNPTERATQKSTQKPTSSKPTTPQIPTQIPTELPENAPDTPDPPTFESNDVCVGYVDESLLLKSTTVYCFVVPTNSDIAFPESPDIYIADVSHIGNGSVRISFAGKNSTYVKQSDFYTFYFYNINGEVIYENTIYITIK